jgi:hypothetical protein
MNDRNLRNIIRVLIQKFGNTRRNLMAANATLQAISSMSPDQRKALTGTEIQAQLKNYQQQLSAQPDPDFVAMDQLLVGDDPLENEMGRFVAGIRW